MIDRLWFEVAIALAGVLIAYGTQKTKLGAVMERTERLEKGAARQGERLEKHNVRIALMEYRSGIRRPTGAVPIDPSESGEGEPR